MNDITFTLRVWWFWVKQFFNSFKNNSIMANALAERIRALTIDKINFENDEAEGVVDGIATSALTLDDAGDAFVTLAAGDVDQEEIAGALVDLADLFDSANLTGAQREKLNGVVNGLLKSGTPEQKEAAKVLFSGALDFGIAAKAANDYFNTLLATPPVEE